MELKTEQEEFWRGDFGDQYVDRNREGLNSKIHLWSDIISHTNNVKSFLELGPNIGLNLQALKFLKGDASFTAVEINHKAAEQCKMISGVEVYEDSILNFQSKKKWDFTFTSGVMIHINPEYLPKVYECLYEHSNKYICIAEYYNPTPVEVLYRGNEGKLFKRDFAGEMLDKYPNLELVSYGFKYHRDNNFPVDDGTWFLLRKNK